LPGEVVKFERGFHFTAIAQSPAQSGATSSTQLETVSMETVSIDELIARGLTPPDIIKIDVEGHELDVLHGAKQLLLTQKPALSIEMHPDLLALRGVSGLAIAKFLKDAGYVFRDMDLKPVKTDFFHQRNNYRFVAM
jgi:hypothetical protein